MRICFVSDGSLSEYSEKYAGNGADIVCFSFSALGQVSYERELKGETSLFEDAAILSKEEKNIVVCGCYTDARGMRRKSAVVAEKGRILGVSDMLNRLDGEEYRAGSGIRVYDTSAGRLGVVVGSDLLFPHVFETLSDCGAELILCLYERLNDTLEQTLMRAWAFTYGVPVCVCARGYAQAAEVTGGLSFASAQSPCIFEPSRAKEFHLIETRRRGFCRQKRGEY